MIRITSKQEGFRRCGIAHSKTAVEYPDDRFGKDELKVLQGEPMLIVEIVKDEPGGADTEKMTNQQLIDEILALDPEARTNGMNKAALTGMLRGLQAAKQG